MTALILRYGFRHLLHVLQRLYPRAELLLERSHVAVHLVTILQFSVLGPRRSEGLLTPLRLLVVPPILSIHLPCVTLRQVVHLPAAAAVGLTVVRALGGGVLRAPEAADVLGVVFLEKRSSTLGPYVVIEALVAGRLGGAVEAR